MTEVITVLVTGGAGFLGGAIVEALLEKHPEYNIIVIDIKPENAYLSKPERVKYLQIDVRDVKKVLHAVSSTGPTAIIHTAGLVPAGSARYGRKTRDSVLEMNVGGTNNMLDAAKSSKVKAFIFTSSCTVITDDLDHDYPNYDETCPIPAKALIYGESKAMAENHVLHANGQGLATCALRPSVIFGEQDYSLVPSLHACIAKRETPFLIGTGDNLFDFAYVGNIADAHVLALENLLTTRTAAGQAIIITNGQPVTFRDLCLAVWAGLGHVPAYRILIPASVAWFMGLFAELLTWVMGTETTLSRGSVKDATGCRYADVSKARKLLGYEARVGMVEGVRRSCEAYKLRLKEKNG